MQGAEARARPGLVALAALLAALATRPDAVEAQQPRSGQPQVDETTLALTWIQGRFRSPVTCIRQDGSRVEVEEAIVIRQASPRSGMPAVRVTFFGIDLPDARRCFNLVEPRVLDRRGVLYLTYRSHPRPDMGLADFRRTLREGEVRYRVVGGQLRERGLAGEEGSSPRVIRFDGRDFPFVVRPVLPQSDDAKLLDSFGDVERPDRDERRRVRFEIEGPEAFRLEAAFIEDEKRWK